MKQFNFLFFFLLIKIEVLFALVTGVNEVKFAFLNFFWKKN